MALTIASIGISLVAPNMIRAYENFKVAAEERKLVEVMASIRMKAFFRNTAFVIKLEDHTLQVAEKGVQVYFEYIAFPAQQFTVNEHGFSDQPRLWYLLSNQPDLRTIEINTGVQ